MNYRNSIGIDDRYITTVPSMDITQCMSILSNRQQCEYNCIRCMPSTLASASTARIRRGFNSSDERNEDINTISGGSSAIRSDDSGEVSGGDVSDRIDTTIGESSSSSSSSSSSLEGNGSNGNKGIVKDVDEALLQLNVLELLNLFSLLQSERVQCYKAFNAALDQLLIDNTIGEYPHLCAEMTSMFSVISQKIIDIRVVLTSRNEMKAVYVINNIQQFEKEKLAVVASLHLDKIRHHLQRSLVDSGAASTVSTEPIDGADTSKDDSAVSEATGGSTTPKPARTFEWIVDIEDKMNRVERIERNVLGQLDALQELKCDLLE